VRPAGVETLPIDRALADDDQPLDSEPDQLLPEVGAVLLLGGLRFESQPAHSRHKLASARAALREPAGPFAPQAGQRVKGHPTAGSSNVAEQVSGGEPGA